MDDEGRNYRGGRPQQKLYRPGSGPLRKSSPGSDITMESCRAEAPIVPPPAPRGRGHGRFRNKNTSHDHHDEYVDNVCRGPLGMRNDEPGDVRRRGRKPERPLYAARPGGAVPEPSSSYCDRFSSSHNDFHMGPSSKEAYRRDANFSSSSQPPLTNDHNFHRNYRQVSEPRSTSPKFQGADIHAYNRNRDTRSMETSANRHNSGAHGGGKPPSGRRNSAGYSNDMGKPAKFMPNLDSLPPRLRKKFLAESGQYSLDSGMDYGRDGRTSPLPPFQPPTTPMWSQTLPSRGRGRFKDPDFERERFMASHLKYDTEGSRHSTPSGSRLNLYEGKNMDHQTNPWHNDYVPASPLADKTNIGSTVKNTISNDNDIFEKIQKHFSPHTNENRQNKEKNHSKCNDESRNNNSSHGEDISTSLSNKLNNLNCLDWTEEVEKNIKLDDVDSSNMILMTPTPKSTAPDVKKTDSGEIRRNNKSRRRDKRRRSGSKKRSAAQRSTSRGNKREKSTDKPAEPLPTQAMAPTKHELHRRDSGQESLGGGHRRERRDSHRSNRSSNLANSREDLDRWRSWRSYSREQSSERRIISQCNSRDPSGNRAGSPRDPEGFRIPQPTHPGNGGSSRNQRRNSGSSTTWSGRVPSSERIARSPPPPPPPLPSGGGGGGEPRKRHRGGKGRARKEAEALRNRTPTRGKSPQHAPPVAPASAPASGVVNWREEILESKKHHKERCVEPSKKPVTSAAEKPASTPVNTSAHPGLLLLPQAPPTHIGNDSSGRTPALTQSKTLYDPQNPSKPIIVQTTVSPTADSRTERLNWAAASAPPAASTSEGAPRPAYYDSSCDDNRSAKNRNLLIDVGRADTQLHQYCSRGASAILTNWTHIAEIRRFLQNALQRLLLSDLKFCSTENLEHQFWKILYYNFIEVLRKQLGQENTEREEILGLVNNIIEEGNKYFESLVELLEKAYKFKVDDYINGHHLTPPKGLGFVGLGLHSVQRMYLFLGDLARYKEQVNDSTNYGKSKFWYTKAQQINPKNGRPYNQLAILAIYSRRKLDAVYYYMRSLMSSNPFHSARESLISLFDENRKKYESAERKRRAAREAARAAAREAAGEATTAPGAAGARGLRREVWVRAGGGRTTTLRRDDPLEDDELANMTCVELNKNFITSYLHVHGKLITKIGMETLHESASQMLRQFRALLRQQPLPTTANRLLQLAALNMFAVEMCSSPPREGGAAGGGGAWIDCALGVALLMFGSLLERCCALLPEPAGAQAHADALLMLPAIKVWCDWMLCHSSVWNPPPCLDNFKLGPDADPWDWLAKFMNILEEQDDKSVVFETSAKEGAEAVRLSEDATMAGFTPLMYMEIEPAYTQVEPAGSAGASAEHALRTRRLLFFGTEYLVGVDPPAIKLHYPVDEPARYVSAVRPPPPPDDEPLQDVSEDEEPAEEAEAAEAASESAEPAPADASDEATRRLLRRKEMLEARRRNMELRRKRMQEILRGGWVSVELEVRPRWLVPDTNCFIDHLPLLQRAALAPHHPYILAVPLVVVTELEGLSRCARVGGSARASLAWLSESSASSATVRFATTRGSLLTSAAFTAESAERHASNDDRVLATALSLHRNLTQAPEEAKPAEGERAQRLVREVVLLTDDRNLRVKALAAELPARDLPAFVQWAALQPLPAPQPSPAAAAAATTK